MKRPKEIPENPLFDQILNDAPVEEKLYVTRSLEIATQIMHIMDKKGLLQKDLAGLMGKSEAEISKWLSGFHNFTLKSIVKIEAHLGEEIIITPKQVEEDFKDAIGKIGKIIVSALNNRQYNNVNWTNIPSTEIKITKKSTPVEAKIIPLNAHFNTGEIVVSRKNSLTGTYSS